MLIDDLGLLVTCFVEANGCDVEERFVVFKADPEATIISYCKVRHLGFSYFVPESRAITPVPSPLFLAPRVSYKTEPHKFASFIFYFLCSYQRVRVSVNQSSLLHLTSPNIVFHLT